MDEKQTEQKQNSEKKEPAPRKGLTGILDRKAIEKFVVNMQRAANDAAVIEIRKSSGGKLPARALVNALGQLLYRVGTQTEYFFLCLARLCLRLLRGARRAAVGIFKALATPCVRFAASMWRDLTAPWRRFASGLRNMRAAVAEERERGGQAHRVRMTYLKSGVKAYHHLVTGALAWLLPLGAAGLLVFTVHSVTANGFSLRVEYEGQVLGFVESETVWDNAVNIVKDRIVAAGDEDSWDPQPQFTIRPVNVAARSTAGKLADDLITSSGDKIQNATGVTVNGELLGVTSDGKALQEALDAVLAPYLQPENTNHQVAFAQRIDLVPGVYFTESVESTEALMETLHANPANLQVQTVDLEEYEEEIPIEEQEQESDQYYTGVRRVVQRGQAGRQHVLAFVTRIDGVEVARVPAEVTVLEEMVPKITAVGTRERVSNFVGGNSGQVGSGAWSFPVPGYTGYSTYPGHRGYDFQAPAGSPIYACETGVVVNAGWHYSWGNYVLIDHQNGLYSLYAHCSALYVAAGQGVSRGQQIAAVGRTGNASGNHLHLEVWTDPSGARWCLANPLSYVTPP